MIQDWFALHAKVRLYCINLKCSSIIDTHSASVVQPAAITGLLLHLYLALCVHITPVLVPGGPTQTESGNTLCLNYIHHLAPVGCRCY